ncbi:MAG: substrate-binding domain-containing protein [Microbispora sp.]|nr:substrate-binding domain-containing protein [Microbispora sp.]
MSVLRGPSRLIALAASAAVTTLAAACGGAGSAPSQQGATSANGGKAAAFEAEARDDVAKAVATQTEQTNPVPTQAPPMATGKKIVIIPCSMAVEGCARPARSAQEAAKAVGWDASIDDPAGDVSKMSAAIKRAVSAKADGIVLNSIDAAAVQGDLRAARDAGLSVVCDMCGDTGGLIQSVSPPLPENERAGYLLGQQAFLMTKERFGAPPKFIVMLDDEFATVRARVAGVKKFIEDCKAAGAGCELVAEGKHLAAEISTTAPGRVVQLARANPQYNVLFAGYDAALNFFSQGLRQAGLADPAKVLGISIDADVANTEAIRTGGFQAASAGVAMKRVGYGMIDDLNRLFAGQQPVPQGISIKLITKANAPATGSWDGDFDATSAYLKLWGVS